MGPTTPDMAEEAYLGSGSKYKPTSSPTRFAPVERPTPLSDCPYVGIPRFRLRWSGLPGPDLKGLADPGSHFVSVRLVRRVGVRSIYTSVYNLKVFLVLVCQGWPDRIRPPSPLRPLCPQSTSIRYIRRSLHGTVILRQTRLVTQMGWEAYMVSCLHPRCILEHPTG